MEENFETSQIMPTLWILSKLDYITKAETKKSKAKLIANPSEFPLDGCPDEGRPQFHPSLPLFSAITNEYLVFYIVGSKKKTKIIG